MTIPFSLIKSSGNILLLLQLSSNNIKNLFVAELPGIKLSGDEQCRLLYGEGKPLLKSF